MRLLPLLVLLAGCSPFAERFSPGRADVLEFRLSNGFWKDTFAPDTAIAAGGSVSLEVRGKGGVLRAVVVDPAVIEAAGEDLTPAVRDGESVWKVTLRALKEGRTVVELRDGETVVDSVELVVVSAASFDWEIYDPDRQSRRADDVLRVLPKESLDLDIWAYDAEGERLAGAGAWEIVAGETRLLADPDPETPHCCVFSRLTLGSRFPLRVEGRVFGSTELRVRGVAGSGAERTIVVKVGI